MGDKEPINHERIWLTPLCDEFGDEGRLWSHNAVPDCEEPGCGCKPVEYIRADLVLTLRPASLAKDPSR